MRQQPAKRRETNLAETDLLTGKGATSPKPRAEEVNGVSRDSVYRHAHALGLMAKRRRNVR